MQFWVPANPWVELLNMRAEGSLETTNVAHQGVSFIGKMKTKWEGRFFSKKNLKIQFDRVFRKNLKIHLLRVFLIN